LFSLPFSFNFFCNTYSTVYISSNGFFSFTNASSDYTSDCGSSHTNSPNNLVSIWWADLYPSGTYGYVQYQTIGTSPNRIFIVRLNNVGHCCSGSYPINAEAKLYETSNIIELHYQNAPTSGSQHFAGIENSTGSTYYEVVCNTSSSLISTARRFTPIYTGGTFTLTEPGVGNVLIPNNATAGHYKNSIGSTLVNAGSGITVTEESNGSYTISTSSGSGGTRCSGDVSFGYGSDYSDSWYRMTCRQVGWNYAHFLILRSELPGSCMGGHISSISFNKDTSPGEENVWQNTEVWLRTTTATSFSTNEPPPPSGATQVYTGTWTQATTSGWETINFNLGTFNWTSDNLEIWVKESNTTISCCSPYYYYSPYSSVLMEGYGYSGYYTWTSRFDMRLNFTGSLLRYADSDEEVSDFTLEFSSIPEYNDIISNGDGKLINGEVYVEFPDNFIANISDNSPIIVNLTPREECNGLFVKSVDRYGFTAKENLNGEHNSVFSWIANAKHPAKTIVKTENNDDKEKLNPQDLLKSYKENSNKMTKKEWHRLFDEANIPFEDFNDDKAIFINKAER